MIDSWCRILGNELFHGMLIADNDVVPLVNSVSIAVGIMMRRRRRLHMLLDMMHLLLVLRRMSYTLCMILILLW